MSEADERGRSLSVVVPVYDEEESLPELARRLGAVLDDLDLESEVLLVDDGSTDSSYPLMVELSGRDPRFKVVHLSRNFGHQVAITAGIELARGDAVVIMDSDLQHPPELLPAFLERWRAGYDVVYGVMQERTESWFKRLTARVFYTLLRRLTRVEMPPAAGDFRLIDRHAVDAFVAMRERNRYVRGMVAWVGFRQVGLEYACPPRFAGRSKYTVRKMLRLALDAIFSFSTVPLRLALQLGLVVSACSVLFGLASLASKFAGVEVVPGWVTIIVVTTFLGGMQLIVLGVMGEYVGRVYDEVKRRPLYLVRRLHGFEDAVAASRVELLDEEPPR